MQIRTLDDWPFAVRALITYGQTLANEKVHAETTGAHVLAGLMTMPCVRKRFEPAANEEIDKACSKAVMVSRRGGATAAILSQPIALMLFGSTTAPSTVPRTTEAFLSGFLQGSMFLDKAAAALRANAAEIAKLLDDARIELLVTKAESPEAKALCSSTWVGLAAATEMQHQYLTARHVAYGALVILDKTLANAGKPQMPEPLEKMKALLERSVSKRGPKSDQLIIHPRLIGAVAQALALTADKPESLEGAIVGSCIVGDPEIDFVMQAISASREHLKS